MKISFQNNTNFTSERLFPIQVPEAKGKVVINHVNAFLSRLNPLDRTGTDQKAISEINQTWKSDKNCIKDFFCANFDKDSKYANPSSNAIYYCIELPLENKPLSEKIICLMRLLIKENKNYCLHQILNKPEFRFNPENNIRKPKSFEIMLGKAFGDAEENNAPHFEFISGNSAPFLRTFEKAGINIFEEERYYPVENTNYFSFMFPNKDFKPFLDYIKKEYSIDFLQRLKDGISA